MGENLLGLKSGGETKNKGRERSTKGGDEPTREEESTKNAMLTVVGYMGVEVEGVVVE